MKSSMLALLAILLSATPSRADRVQVYSITGVDCVECSFPIKAQLKKVKGVKKTEFDMNKVEMTVSMGEHVRDDVGSPGTELEFAL